jgi:hypothetical protein
MEFENQIQSKTKAKDGSKCFTRLQTIRIRFDYPLGEDVYFTFQSWDDAENKNGFTRQQFLDCVRKGYSRIYRKPQASGVWGHRMGDLVLQGAYRANRTNVFVLGIGS